MDYLCLKAAVKEAQGLVTRRKVREARQLSETEVALLFARGPALLLSIDARRPGLFLLDPAHVPDAREGPFSQFLRSRFEASVMSVMTMPQAGERLVTMTFKTAWPHGPGKGPELILEVMGRHSNLVAVQEGRILMALKVVPESKSRVRPVVPGSIWSPPPPLEGVPVEAATEGDLPLPEDPEAARRLMAGVRGLSPYSTSQALLRASEGGRRGLLDGLKAMLASATGEKGYLYHAGQAAHLSPFEPVLNVDGDRVEPFVPFSAAARAWRGSVPSMEPGKGRDVALLQEGLRRRESEIETALSKLQGEQERCLESGQVRLMAETLLVHTSLVPHGASFALLPSPYDAGVKLNIPLDPALSAHENANRLFARARRLKRGLEEVKGRRDALKEEKARLEAAIRTLSDTGDADPARELLGPEAHGQTFKGRRASRTRIGPGRRYIEGGFTILVGRSAVDNERVTFQVAGPGDLWLHARDHPGSHVVILTEKRQVPDPVLYRAAELAAEGSGARNESTPEIMVTERKWVKKIRGGRPGQVAVERYRTIRPKRRI